MRQIADVIRRSLISQTPKLEETIDFEFMSDTKSGKTRR